MTSQLPSMLKNLKKGGAILIAEGLQPLTQLSKNLGLPQRERKKDQCQQSLSRKKFWKTTLLSENNCIEICFLFETPSHHDSTSFHFDIIRKCNEGRPENEVNG